MPLYAALLSVLTGCSTVIRFSSTGTAVVSPTVDAEIGPLTITKGGSYSGTWTSNDPNTPAVNILTNEPVTLHNAVLTGRGDLIDINGTGTGANVTVEDVTGTALDPGVAGMQRGAFISANDMSSLDVEHTSMFGVSFGIKVLSSTVSKLKISKNTGSNLEDRASDGAGGLLTTRPNLGHFIFLYKVSAPAGADIGWNQLVNTIGSSSTEDVVNLFKSEGTAGHPLRVHNNYMEGYSSTTTASYTGAGLITDGDGEAPETAFVEFIANRIVHTAGSGIAIASGHDILAKNNHIVSCGLDAGGTWFAMPFVNAVNVWNYYHGPQFDNITVEGTTGGMLRPSASGQPLAVDLWAQSSDLNSTDSVGNNAFTDPCLANGQINPQAEETERAAWAAKLTKAGITLGDQDMPGDQDKPGNQNKP
ncbi:MAG: hypothetical protein ACRYFU_26900 [Janthinobacterium lividum]